jgi:S1-C subfamily serine protease
MNVSEGMPSLLAMTFLALISAVSAIPQGLPQNPSPEDPIAGPKSEAGIRPPEWAEVVAQALPAVVVIETDEGLASGFIIKPDGTIVTNHHVVANAKEMSVKLQTGEVYRNVSLLNSDSTNDLAFVKIEAVDLPTIPLGNSNKVQVGDAVLLVGAPQGLEQTASDGLISGIRVDDGVKVLQTSAAASHGSSGGPLLNRSGEAVGVMSFKLVNGENLNFTIPINYVRGKLDTLASSNPRAFSPLSAHARHRGVLVAGHGSEYFEDILTDVLDLLGANGVELANDGMVRITESSRGFLPLSTLLERLPTTGADSLLYLKVEPTQFPSYASVYFQCFDASGKILWEEQAKTVKVGGENTVFHPNGWKSRLTPHIGKAGLLLKQGQEEGSPAPKK